MSYSTKQKDLILNVIKSKCKDFTIKDIYDEVKDSAGLTTIYRLIDKLVDEGLVNKSLSKDNITYYEYLGECNKVNHFYLKCEKCKEIEHIDCDCILKLYDHINNKHNFKLKKENIIINGICKKCEEKYKLC